MASAGAGSLRRRHRAGRIGEGYGPCAAGPQVSWALRVGVIALTASEIPGLKFTNPRLKSRRTYELPRLGGILGQKSRRTYEPATAVSQTPVSTQSGINDSTTARPSFHRPTF
ncbi:hypothetical protein PGT21_003823 [Puccinia graminis f. sp. tritici]|uniref:Uncharacterized protein n=1 Tax=Puccinia graminis f. sp. tritici TaxID=56615 RepID=A0A5B0MQA6_PUCGR|nr:hypothetical protein PGT21_003823 [Puccinia graminis f. sp. tritici]